jgi:hypothetical protein
VTTSPGGGLIAIPVGGTTITLTAQGGTARWTMTVSGGAGTVTVTPSSGTLQSGQSETVTVTASDLAAGETLTVSPGGTCFLVLLGWARPLGLPTTLPLPLGSLSPVITSLPPLRRDGD